MVVSFDFDDTLLLTRPCADWGTVGAGPNKPMLAALREHAACGDTAIIVTTRNESRDAEAHKGMGPSRTPVSMFVALHGLPVESIHFTDGEHKAETLVVLGVSKHFDDDDDDELAQIPEGIEGVLTPIGTAPARFSLVERFRMRNPPV